MNNNIINIKNPRTFGSIWYQIKALDEVLASKYSDGKLEGVAIMIDSVQQWTFKDVYKLASQIYTLKKVRWFLGGCRLTLNNLHQIGVEKYVGEGSKTIPIGIPTYVNKKGETHINKKVLKAKLKALRTVTHREVDYSYFEGTYVNGEYSFTEKINIDKPSKWFDYVEYINRYKFEPVIDIPVKLVLTEGSLPEEEFEAANELLDKIIKPTEQVRIQANKYICLIREGKHRVITGGLLRMLEKTFFPDMERMYEYKNVFDVEAVEYCYYNYSQFMATRSISWLPLMSDCQTLFEFLNKEFGYRETISILRRMAKANRLKSIKGSTVELLLVDMPETDHIFEDTTEDEEDR